MLKLFDYQVDAVQNLDTGKILCGGVGSGKSLTSIAYYYLQNGGRVEGLTSGRYIPMEKPQDLYIITTARKRDTFEWEGELSHFLMTTKDDGMYNHNVIIDSWNNIKKYIDVKDAFFIFDEQRLVGNGVWVKSFHKIAKHNAWILLSATPGDTWQDYLPVFLANGFFKNKTQFNNEHVVFSRYAKFPKVDRYVNTRKLVRLRDKLLVDMDFHRETESVHEDIILPYDILTYKRVMKTRWNVYKDKPLENAGELCYTLRKIVNSDESRQLAVQQLFEEHPKLIIFYNFDYELEILREIYYGEDVEIAEWNGHKHQELPTSDKWVYLVQYTSGCEGWNCITTDTIIFFSQNYSYKVMHQAAGRIDRLNTPYSKLFYYHLKSKSNIDLSISRAITEKRKFNETKWLSTKGGF